MKPYMLSPIIEGSDGATISFHAAVQDAPETSVKAMIPLDDNPQSPNFGKAKYKFCFCRVAAFDLIPALQVTNTFRFPDYPMDGLMSGIPLATRLAMVQSLQAYDIDGGGMHLDASYSETESYGEYLLRLFRSLEPSADLDRLDIPYPVMQE